MEKVLSYFGFLAWSILGLSTSFCFAEFGGGSLPPEVIKEILSNLNGKDLNNAAHLNTKCRDKAYEIDNKHWKTLADNVDTILKKYGDFIQLPSGDLISPVAPTQQLWVRVMRNNPSYFKRKKYCPDTYKAVVVNGTTIGMCPDFQVEKVRAVNKKRKNSDVELIAELNRIYRKAGLNVEFRRPTREEYDWADTEGGANPKVWNDPYLGKLMPYWHVSSKDPRDLNKRSPSGDHQLRSVFDNSPNAWGFRRSGVREWVEDKMKRGSHKGLVGGSWFDEPKYADSNYIDSSKPSCRWSNIGPAHLVRIQK